METAHLKRWLTGIILSAILLGVIFYGSRELFLILVLAAGGLGTWECLHLFFPGNRGIEVLGLLLGLLLILLLTREISIPAALLLSALSMLALSVLTFLYKGERKTLDRPSWFLLGVLYVAPLISTAYLIYKGAKGPLYICMTAAIVFAGDTLAYYCGRTWGKRPLAPLISPKKTWEGALGGLLGSLLAVLPFKPYVPEFSLSILLLLAAGCGICAQVGDLAESCIKRSVGVKDSGKILPGHGGLLDRLDGFLFALPVFYGYLYLTGSY